MRRHNHERCHDVFRTTAMSAAGLVAGVTTALIAAAPAVAESQAEASYACEVTYTPTINWFTLDADIVLKNVGELRINGWTLKFNLPARQLLVDGRNARFTQSETEVTGVNLEHNAVLERGEIVTLEITVIGGNLTARPTNFKVNEVPCTT